MKEIGVYISEKLRINNNTKLALKYPVSINIWADWSDPGNLREEINNYTPLKNFPLKKLEGPSIIRKKECWCFEIEIENKNDLLWLLIYCYGCFSSDQHFSGTDIFKDIIENYNDVENYILDFPPKDYQRRINDYMSYINNAE